MSVYAESFFESRLGTLVLAAILGASLFWIFFPTNPGDQQEDTSEGTGAVTRNFPRYDMDYHIPPATVRARTVLTTTEMAEIKSRYHSTEDRLLAELERKYGAEIRYWTSFSNCPWQLPFALLRNESSGDPYALSRSNAMGLMQLIPSTAKYVGVDDPWNPSKNIYGGVKYACRDVPKAGARSVEEVAIGYNWGPHRLPVFWETGRLPQETQVHRQRVVATYRRAIQMFQG